MRGDGPHSNACWAARAAEAARIVRGLDGFRRMHRWLVEHEGAFTEELLRTGAEELGVDPEQLLRTMTSEATLARVRADVDEGLRLGVVSTPTIFLNGVELRGRLARRAVPRAVEALLAARAPASFSVEGLPNALAADAAWTSGRPSLARDDESPSSLGVAAIVAGEPIAWSELEQTARVALDRLALERWRLLRAALDQLAGERMLAHEATTRGLSVDELRRREIDGGIEEPTRAEIEEVYRLNPDRAGGRRLEEVAPSIRDAIRARRRREREAQLVSELAAKYGYRVELVPPRLHVDVPPGTPVRGAADAPVTIVEFADFECAHCRHLQPVLARLLADYSRQLRVCFRDFPIPAHPGALEAAIAARAASEQGGFWDYYDDLMTQPGDLSGADLDRRAAALGLDVPAFRESRRSNRHRAAIDADVARGRELGVNATPTLFLNGRPRVGAHTYEELAAAVEDELRSAGAVMGSRR